VVKSEIQTVVQLRCYWSFNFIVVC